MRTNRAAAPTSACYIDDVGPWSWEVVDQLSDEWAGAILAAGVARNDRLVVLMPDGAPVHIGFIAAEKAGVIAVGIGARAGYTEVAHLASRTGAVAIMSGEQHDGGSTSELVARLAADGVDVGTHIVISDDLGSVRIAGRDLVATPNLRSVIDGRRFGPNELAMINSTSGTTGMPKCVMHNQNRWWYFHQLAVACADLTPADVFFSAVPMPFGFGLWTSHFTPAYLGSSVGVMRRFSPTRMIEAIERDRVTVLSCVSSQFIMMLNVAESNDRDLSSLRVLFTGGEAVPYERAAEFEQRFGASVLQFYGSNETGALSNTSMTDSRDARLRTAGKIIPDMDVIMLGPDRERLALHGTAGQPACVGPATALGYWDDDAANRQLFTEDGWMLMGDIVEIDDDDYLRVVGRVADFIIRGGKNVSAPAVEAEVLTHPAVALAAAVPDPDPVLGERVGVYVTLRPGTSLTLEELVAHLRERGMSKDSIPERLTVLDDMPMSSGGKVAKGELRSRHA
ncbi:MAG TPA: class I adenylate-forming enzyme family protein [Ilumatobacteraceae bacterium]